MYWLSRPPVARYAFATALVLMALWLEVRPADTVLHPFAPHPIPLGTTLTPSEVEFRAVPSGLLPPVSLPQITDRSLNTGDPILPTDPLPAVPADWWALELPSAGGMSPGARVRVVVTGYDQPVVSTLGMVVDTGERYGESTVMVAVAEEWADTVAAAAQEDRVILMVSG